MAAARATTTLPLIDEALCGPPLTQMTLSESDSVAPAAPEDPKTRTSTPYR